MRKNILLAGFLLTCLGGFAQHDAKARAILDKMAASYQQAGAVSIRFGGTQDGTLKVKGNKFYLNCGGIETWFDGTTQWSYVERNEEVNVANPTGDELRFTNPALLLRTYREGFSASLTGESTAPNGKAAYDVELTPSKKADVTKVRLQIEKYSGFPASITVEAKNGVSTTVRISQLKTGVKRTTCLSFRRPTIRTWR